MNLLCLLVKEMYDAESTGIPKMCFSEAKVLLHNIKTAIVIELEARILYASCPSTDVWNYLLSLGFVSNTSFDLARRHGQQIGSALSKIGELRTITGSSIQQSLMMLDLTATDSGFSPVATKTRRDTAGAYYTPPLYAKGVSAKTFLLAEGFDCSTDFCADLSCGAGDFLKAALQHLMELGHSGLDAISCLWGYDIDPTALSLCVLELIAAADIPLHQARSLHLSDHFHFGNPALVFSQDECKDDSLNRIELYALGLYYDPGMALSQADFPMRGFKVIVGNPPWEKVRMEERKFFQLSCPEIGRLSSKSLRAEAISRYRQDDPYGIFALYDLLSASYRNFGDYLNPSVRSHIAGELNTYAIFALLSLNLVSSDGAIGLILKSALFTSPVNSKLFQFMLSSGSICSIHLFSNQKGVFSIDRRERFCVALFSPKAQSGVFLASFGNTDCPLLDAPVVSLSESDLEKINPSSKTLPDIDDSRVLEFLLREHRAKRVFAEVYPDCHFGRLVHLTSHAKWITKTENEGNLPIFEGKFLGQHDLRYATFEGVSESMRYRPKASARLMSEEEKLLGHAQSRFFIDKTFWNKISKNYSRGLMLCWRSLTSPTNYRTTIAALSPFVPACQSIQFLQHGDARTLILLAGLFNSKAFDYLVRQKIPGIDLTRKVIEQIPVPEDSAYDKPIVFDGVEASLRDHITTRVLGLYAVEAELLDLLMKEGIEPPSRRFDRVRTLAELDALFYIAYGFTTRERKAIEDSF